MKPKTFTIVSFLSIFLIVLCLASFLVFQVTKREMLLSRALSTSVLLENALHMFRPPTPDAIKDLVEDFRAEDIAYIAIYRNNHITWAHSDPSMIGKEIYDPRLDLAFQTLEVQSGFSKNENDEEIFDVFIPIKRGRGLPPRWLKPNIDSVQEPRPKEIVIRIGMIPKTSSWLQRWVIAETIASVLVIIFMWVAVVKARRMEKKIKKMEEEKKKREVLAKVGEMSAVLAHEIRNPLAGTKGHLQLSLERNDRTKERIEIALNEIERIEHLINGLLDFVREKHLSKKVVNVSDLISRAIFLSQARFLKPEVEVKMGRSLQIKVDLEHMSRCLANIIENAKEASGADGKVFIEVFEREMETVIVVEDSGKGIDEDVKMRLFEPFVTNKIRGIGLGLAVAKQIVDAHNGKIEVGRSMELGGARFEIRIPKEEL